MTTERQTHRAARHEAIANLELQPMHRTPKARTDRTSQARKTRSMWPAVAAIVILFAAAGVTLALHV